MRQLQSNCTTNQSFKLKKKLLIQILQKKNLITSALKNRFKNSILEKVSNNKLIFPNFLCCVAQSIFYFPVTV